MNDHYPSAAEGVRSLGFAQNGKTAPQQSLIARLCDLRTNLGRMSMELQQFQRQLNGDPPEPVSTGATVGGGYPPCSIEDIMSQIEQNVADIAGFHQRIASRF